MLYLEARCIAVTRAAGSQGVQNGGIDGVSVDRLRARRHARGARREPARDDARPRVVHRQRHADVGLGHPPHGAHAAAAAGGLGLPLLGLRLDPGLRQRVRALQLQRRGHRRLPRRAARLGLRGRACARAPSRAPAAAPARGRGLRAVLDELDLAQLRRRGRRGVRARPRQPRRARAAGQRRAERGRRGHAPRAHRARRRARARDARLRGRGRARARDAAPAPLRRHAADLGDLRRGHARPLEAERPQRLPRARAPATA